MKVSLENSKNLTPERQADVPKIRCAFHENEHITNFCSCISCLLPLCPSCIKIHVNEHSKMKSQPEIQNMTDVLKGVHQEMTHYASKFGQTYKNVIEMETHIEQFREMIGNRIANLKQDLLKMVEENFNNFEAVTNIQISQMNYVKNLQKYKEYSKRILLNLKQHERNFFTDEANVMRTLIKYETNEIRNGLEEFLSQNEDFIRLFNKNFLTLSVREDYRSNFGSCLNGIYKMTIQDIDGLTDPVDLTAKLRGLNEKINQKQELKKSLGQFLSQKNTPSRMLSTKENYQSLIISRNDSPNKQSALSDNSNKQQSRATFEYSSVPQTQPQETRVNRSIKQTDSSEESHVRRRSSSKAKGLSLIQPTLLRTNGDFRRNNHAVNLLRNETTHIGLIHSGMQFPRKFR